MLIDTDDVMKIRFVMSLLVCRDFLQLIYLSLTWQLTKSFCAVSQMMGGRCC